MPKMTLPQFVIPSQARGFTLLEMLLVVFLMGMLALATTAMVDNADEQQRFETTRSRLQQIRTAIIGDTSRTLNGEPMISGFVADMGRLPTNIQELVEMPSGLEPWGYDDFSYSGVSDVSAVKIELYSGWRGPYLDVMPTSGLSAVRAFRDGWGNPDEIGHESNFGWNVNSVSPVLSIQSYGADGPTGTGTGTYEVDYPAHPTDILVESNDWKVGLSRVSIPVEFNNATKELAPPTLKLRIYYMEDGAIATGAIATTLPYESDSFELGLSTVSAQAVFSAPKIPHLGRHAAIVICSNTNVYDGDCSGNSLHSKPYYFNLLPRTQLPTIKWNTP